MMKYKLIFFSVFLSITLFGQRSAQGDTFFNNKQYAKALPVYEALLKQKPNDALYNFRYARCCYELKELESAIKHFEKVGNKYPLRDLYLGELYFKTYRFDESVKAYQGFIATLKPDDNKLPDYQKELIKAEKFTRLFAKVEDIAVVDSVVVNKNDFLRFYKFSSELGTISQELLKLNSHRSVDKIQYTTQRKDRIYYSDSIKGQMDIFTSYKLLDTWSDAISASNIINTPANENYPFLLLDGITLYFASDGENSMGGYDIFITRYTPSSDSFLAPENIGFPFNSPYNDYMMVIDEQRKLGWFATDRYQPAGKVMIYTFVPNEAKKTVHTEDKEYLRRVAQLKTYRKLISTISDSTIENEKQLQETEKQIEFVLNDSVVYTQINQFKSEEAIKLWEEMHKLATELKHQKMQLDDFRLQYDRAEKTDERNILVPKIIELEKNIPEIEKQISIKMILIRNAEIKHLEKVL